MMVDCVAFEKDEVSAGVKFCLPPPQLVMKSKGCELYFRGPGGESKYTLESGNQDSIYWWGGELEFKGEKGTLKYKKNTDLVARVANPIAPVVVEVYKGEELVGKMVKGHTPLCKLQSEKVLLRVQDAEGKDLYTHRVEIDNCCDSLGIQNCPAECKKIGPPCPWTCANLCKAPICKLNPCYKQCFACQTTCTKICGGKMCKYTDAPSSVIAWLGPGGTGYEPMAWTGSDTRTHNVWPGYGTKDAFGDLPRAVYEKRAIAFATIPLMELVKPGFSEEEWGAFVDSYMADPDSYKGLRGGLSKEE
jgi:hypothetical protein